MTAYPPMTTDVALDREARAVTVTVHHAAGQSYSRAVRPRAWRDAIPPLRSLGAGDVVESIDYHDDDPPAALVEGRMTRCRTTYRWSLPA